MVALEQMKYKNLHTFLQASHKKVMNSNKRLILIFVNGTPLGHFFSFVQFSGKLAACEMRVAEIEGIVNFMFRQIIKCNCGLGSDNIISPVLDYGQSWV